MRIGPFLAVPPIVLRTQGGSADEEATACRLQALAVLPAIGERGKGAVNRHRNGEADGAHAKRLATELRRRGVLAGITGRYTNVLKIRPPLPFAPEHVEVLTGVLDDVLSRFELRGGDDARALGAEW